MDEQPVTIIPVAPPRLLTKEEQELLDFLIASRPDLPEMRAQAASAKVAGR